jgi:predicted AAA+ superfamily ATPase
MRERGYYETIWREFDSRKRLIFISGPRQSGKTTLANFFEKLDRKRDDVPLVILDEIHKWIYDGFHDSYRFLVTGSGRLDLFQRKGNSLAGRCRQFHLFPFTLGELCPEKVASAEAATGVLELPSRVDKKADGLWDTLFHCSGFPEPLLGAEERTYRRWAASCHRQVIREDIRDALSVKQIDVSPTTVSAWIEVFRRFYP